MTTQAPERSLEQRLTALARANDIRIKRASVKRELKAEQVSFLELLGNLPDYLTTAKVYNVLLATPTYGRVKVNKILSRCAIPPNKAMGSLSERQVRALRDALRER